MKYQNFAIIFVVIILPLAIVLSYYIQSQTDTLTLQTKYQTKLNDSTYDAIAAYQMNSLNTQKVSGESVKSYVLASVNTFFTTLATNLGMSGAAKTQLQEYVPAILFTTYDGYYIYSSVKTPMLATNPRNGNTLITKDREIVYISDAATPGYKISDESNIDGLVNEITQRTSNEVNSMTNFTTDTDNAKDDYNYMLKPFIFYSAEYQSSDFDITASYTLDNYITLYGTKSTGRDHSDSLLEVSDEFSKSGYIIDPTKITMSGTLLVKGIKQKNVPGSTDVVSEPDPQSNSKDYQAVINDTNANVRYIPIDITTTAAYNYVNYYSYNDGITGSQAYTTNPGGQQYYPYKITPTGLTTYETLRCQTGDEIIESTLDIEEIYGNDPGALSRLVLEGSTFNRIIITYDGVEITDRDAKEYYIKAYFLSTWINNNLGGVTPSTMQQGLYITGDTTNDLAYTSFVNDNTPIFSLGPDNNPESEDSPIAQHKKNVIRNSIQYNLNTAISTYNEDRTVAGNTPNYQLPVLSQDDWDNVLNNVCMVTFLQDIPCGLKKFNNYAVVKSNNNNTSVSIDNLYFTEEIGVNEPSIHDYHKIDCPDLESTADTYQSDMSCEFKYDARKLNAKIASDTGDIICFYDDINNTYYPKRVFDTSIDQNLPSNIAVDYDNPIPNTELTNYEFNGNTYNLTTQPNGSQSQQKYLYDHQNSGCYKCIISSNYDPVVKYINGELGLILRNSDNETIIGIPNAAGTISDYFDINGNELPATAPISSYSPSINMDEYRKRKRSLYTAIAKERNNLYKNNGYVNR